jgi:hypothetical protein
VGKKVKIGAWACKKPAWCCRKNGSGFQLLLLLVAAQPGGAAQAEVAACGPAAGLAANVVAVGAASAVAAA